MDATTSMPGQRRFIFLQGPHGPFFEGLGQRIRAAGYEVWRVGFNRADQAFWRSHGYIAFRETLDVWPETLAEIIRTRGITDLVCYGASRPVHRVALEVCRTHRVTSHVFEEGYLRPYWITYERGGANASSSVVPLSLTQMEAALSAGRPATTEVPDHWGDMRAHIFWGAAYHAVLMGGNRDYPGFRPHRTPDVGREFMLHLRKLLSTPWRDISRRIASSRIRHGGFPYHLVMMQLAHDANFRDHGPFKSQSAFLETVFRGFAQGAPRHHHLVLKAHPLEDGREPIRPLVRHLSQAFGLEDRVHYIAGGKLARLLDSARSAITVNSTSAEQALWRGLPLKAFGEAVYNRPEFVSRQPLSAFFNDPTLPDREAYLAYRAFLLATCQIPGGFYATRNRRKLLRQMPDLMLAPQSPIARLLAGDRAASAAGRQHLSIVSQSTASKLEMRPSNR